MDFDLDDVEVHHRPESGRFEAVVQGRKAYVSYRKEDGRLVLDHTWVPGELENHGLAGKITRTALDHARSEGLKVVPECPYVDAWISKHPDYGDLVAAA